MITSLLYEKNTRNCNNFVHESTKKNIKWMQETISNINKKRHPFYNMQTNFFYKF